MFAYRRTLIRRRVIVNTDTGRAWNGIIWAKRGPLLVLRDAVLLEPSPTGAAVDGEVVIERRRIEFIQVVS